jgi:hypothetical protein
MNVDVCARWLAIALCALGVSVPAAAQLTTGSVAGKISNVQGPVPAAVVTLTSETRGNKLPDATTNAAGEFVILGVPADTYQLSVTASGFKTLTRAHVLVSPGARAAVEPLILDVGTADQSESDPGTTPLVQSRSGERSTLVPRESLAALPVTGRAFTTLALLAPGIVAEGGSVPQRLGGGGDANVLLDGVSILDTGNNRPMLQPSVESIAQLKVIGSSYQAEFGRSSGPQIIAVTRSGTNGFHGSVYDVERNSDWDQTRKDIRLNGESAPVRRERDWGGTFGGPVGRPGAANKLFFFVAHEMSPRTQGATSASYRVPTTLERQGDFSKTLDSAGNLYPYIKDPALAGACSAISQVACFKDGGVLGRIPAGRLYGPGLALLNRYPAATVETPPFASSSNFTAVRPQQTATAWQPTFRIDYQPTPALRASFRYSASRQGDDLFIGTVPGFNDTAMQRAPVTTFAASASYALSPSTFIEATFGRSQNELAGCLPGQAGPGAVFCNRAQGDQGIPMNAAASLAASGLGGLPFLFPDATVLDPRYYAVDALNELSPSFWNGSRMAKVPSLNWGSRVGGVAPSSGFPTWFNLNRTYDLSASVTKLWGRHTFRAGLYHSHSFKAEQTSNTAFGAIDFGQDATSPYDTSFGFANAAVGSFSSFTQSKKYVETNTVYSNVEAFIQDNFRAHKRLTIDLGVRFVSQRPQYDTFGQASNFLPDRWSLDNAPRVYIPGCVNGAAVCSASSDAAFRQAVDLETGTALGINSIGAVGTIVPGSGNLSNGLYLPGQSGVPRATYRAPTFVYAPRFGVAFDVRGNGAIVLRGGTGLFYDRPSTTTFSRGVNNPPTSGVTTLRYSQLQSLGTQGTKIVGAPTINGIQYESEIPTDVQWNGGVQAALPMSWLLDVSYVGHHSYNGFDGVNINAIDRGTYFEDVTLDKTVPPSTIPGVTVLPENAVRPYRGYGPIVLQLNRAWRTYHSAQLAIERRFGAGLSVAFADTFSLVDRQQAPAFLVHDESGQWHYSTDQFTADEILGDNNPVAHTMRASFVLDLPDLARGAGWRRVAAPAANGWRLSGVWSGSTGAPYSVGLAYQNGSQQSITGSPDVAPRLAIVGDPGLGCSKNRFQQFDYAAFAAPPVGSDGLTSGANYLRGCFQSALDLSFQRNFGLGGSRSLQLRLDVFNLPNTAIVTMRNSTVLFRSITDQTVVNRPVDDNGVVLADRIRPDQAGVGSVTRYQNARSFQAQVRFSF